MQNKVGAKEIERRKETQKMIKYTNHKVPS